MITTVINYLYKKKSKHTRTRRSSCHAYWMTYKIINYKTYLVLFEVSMYIIFSKKAQNFYDLFYNCVKLIISEIILWNSVVLHCLTAI